MEWLILILVVPVIIVLVVLLYGFVGCGETLAITPTADVPTDFKATPNTPNGTGQLDLKWLHTSATALFTVTRTAPAPQVIVTDTAKQSAEESGLKDGNDFTYSLVAKDNGVTSDAVTATATTKPKPPVNLRFTRQDAGRIDLEWDHVSDSNKKITFKVEHRPKNLPGSGFTVIKTIDKVLNTTTTSHEDAAVLTAGSDHEYKVTAVIPDGFVDSVSGKAVSSESVTGSVKTWAVAFEKALTDPQDLGGYSLIQRIPAGQLQKSGTKVRITVRSSGGLTLDKVYISQADTPPPAWKPVPPGLPGGLTKVAENVPVPANTPHPLPAVDYTIPDPREALLIAFDISSAAGQGNVTSVLLSGSDHYFKQGAPQAEKTNRDADLMTGQGRHYLVEKIEVL